MVRLMAEASSLRQSTFGFMSSSAHRFHPSGIEPRWVLCSWIFLATSLLISSPSPRETPCPPPLSGASRSPSSFWPLAPEPQLCPPLITTLSCAGQKSSGIFPFIKSPIVIVREPLPPPPPCCWPSPESSLSAFDSSPLLPFPFLAHLQNIL